MDTNMYAQLRRNLKCPSLARGREGVILIVTGTFREYLLPQGVKAHTGGTALYPTLPAEAAKDALERRQHLFIPQRVDDGVDQRVTLGKDQEVLLHYQDTFPPLEAVDQEDYQTGGPADDKST